MADAASREDFSVPITTPLDDAELASPPIPLCRFTVKEYHRLIEVGVLIEGDPIELLEGWLAVKLVRGPRHDATVNHLHDIMRGLLPAGWSVRGQSAMTTRDSEPEPDLAVVPGTAKQYAKHHPGPKEVALVVEVAESTLQRDRGGVKARLYARAGLACYWIVNLIENVVEVYSDPSGRSASPRYRTRRDFRLGDSAPVVLEGREIGLVDVSELLS